MRARPICKYCGKPVKRQGGSIQVGKDFFCDNLCQEFNTAFDEVTNRRIRDEQEKEIAEAQKVSATAPLGAD